MAALIWDSASQAFVETSNVPMRYDAESRAWVETTGMTWDADAQAWTERWSPNRVLYLYNEGDECTDVTGGWVSREFKYYSSAFTPYVPQITKNSDHIYIAGIPAGTRAGIVCAACKIDLTAYTKLCCVASGEAPYASSTWASIGIYSDFYHYYNWEYPHKYIVEAAKDGSGDRVATEKLIEVDISGMEGSFYVGIWMTSSASYGFDYVKLHQCWLE